MTVGTQLKQTLAALKGAESTLSKYSAHHPDPQVKHDFKQAQDELGKMIADLEKRVGQIEFEEPQFKGF